MSGRRLPGAALLLSALLLPPALLPGRVAAQGSDPRELVRQLRDGTAAERVAALEALALLGEGARPALEEALHDPDPDLRFHALYLLRAPEGAVERSLRRIAFGRPDKPGATRRPSLDAYERLLKRAGPGLRGQLLRIAHRSAPLDQPRLVIVALSLWSQLARTSLASERAIPEGEAALLAELLTLDLGPNGSAGWDLLEALAVLPPALRLSTLRGALSSEDPKTQARAARALGEVAEPTQATEVRRLLVELAEHEDARVRLQALYSLGLCEELDPASRLAIVKACRDPQDAVLRVALRLAGEQRLSVAREALEQAAADLNRPLETRREALRSLGLLGEAAAIPALRRLAADPGELGASALWALGALGAPGVEAELAERIESAAPREARTSLRERAARGEAQDLLCIALARLGARGHAVLRGYLFPKPPFPRGTALELQHLRTQAALNAYRFLDTPGAGADLERLLRLPAQLDAVGRGQRLRAAEVLALRRDPDSIRLVAELLIRPGAIGAEFELLEGLVRHGVPSQLQGDASRIVAGLLLRFRNRQAARALARIDPTQARRLLSGLASRTSVRNRETHDLAQVLARVGDPGPLVSQAIPYAQAQLQVPQPEQAHFSWAVNLGVDYLRAKRYEDARLAFLRVHWTRPHWYQDTPAYDLGCAAALEGDPTSALRLLRRAVRYGYKNPEQIRYDVDLVPLRREPRFRHLVTQLELAAETGHAPPVLPLP